MTQFQNAHTQIIDWANEHGTARQKGVEKILPIAATGDALERFRRVGSVVNEVVTHAFQKKLPLRVDGARWSLSAVGKPEKLALSLAAHDVLERLPEGWLTNGYATRLAAESLTPLIVSGSMKISRINRLLTQRNLALRTSGASNGQTLAGATTTGTHGAAVRFGAVHDMIAAIHLFVGPNKTVLVQPSAAPFKVKAAQSLENWFGIPTELVSDDEAFEAARVGLGSVGLILNVFLEVEPLYFLSEVLTPIFDDGWKKVLAERSAASFPGHAKDPFNLALMLQPYDPHPKNNPRAWVSTATKTLYTGQNDVEIDPDYPTRPNPDLIDVITTIADIVGGGELTPLAFRKVLTDQLNERYGTQTRKRKALPGVIFGPTGLPKGKGHSMELVVDAVDALLAVETVMGVLQAEMKLGRQFLGALSARFVGKSSASLAPNARAPSCFIEVPGIRTSESEKIYKTVGRALKKAGIAFGCHWGQYLTESAFSLEFYFGAAKKAAWIRGREKLLPTPEARAIFASPILGPTGLAT